MNIVCIGAHPDDAEVFAGGTMALWAQAGHRVVAVSVVNGEIGHHEMGGKPLVDRRLAEMGRAAAIGGYETRCLHYRDGEFMPSIEARRDIVRLLREAEADLVLTHRPVDYHPDHRYTSMTVQDAAYMVTVPQFCPETPRLARNPVFAYMMDSFTRPVPMRADVAVDVGPVMDAKWAMLDAMESQVYEWLPWIEAYPEPAPEGGDDRRRFLREMWDPLLRKWTEQGRAALAERYGPDRGTAVAYAELFEICEYGRQPDAAELEGLFPLGLW
jgi:LmbE family N-acetylglucosaminyl deacetylase